MGYLIRGRKLQPASYVWSAKGKSAAREHNFILSGMRTKKISLQAFKFFKLTLDILGSKTNRIKGFRYILQKVQNFH